MTTDDLRNEWQKLAVVIDDKMFPLNSQYLACWGWYEGKGLLFDRGGPQGSDAHLFIVGENDTLVSVNPENPADTCVIGTLVRTEEKISKESEPQAD